MSDKGKYYWIKLQKDFFKRHDIRIVESMPNGKDYILFYLKLLVESVSHYGHLRFNDAMPYTPEMLGVITNTNVDIVKSAIKIFEELKMVDLLDDETIFMAEIDRMVGSETVWAEKKRQYRLEKGQCPQLVQPLSDKSIELELELDKEYIYGDFFETLWKLYPKKKGKGQVSRSQKQKLYKIGTEEMTRCIERYKKDASGTDEQFLQYGSTFFNSGYVDYLDKNYTETKKEQQGKYKDLSNYNPV